MKALAAYYKKGAAVHKLCCLGLIGTRNFSSSIILKNEKKNVHGV